MAKGNMGGQNPRERRMFMFVCLSFFAGMLFGYNVLNGVWGTNYAISEQRHNDFYTLDLKDELNSLNDAVRDTTKQLQRRQPCDKSSVSVTDAGDDEEEKFDILIVGVGLSGTVLADLYARKHNKRILMLDRRPHIGGNVYDEIDSQTGIRVSKYGAHLFHTSKEDVWDYVHRFSEWTPYFHRVVGRVDGKLIPIPVNIDTVNTLLNQSISTVPEMSAFMEEERKGGPQGEPANSRDVGMQRVGERLYEKLFKEYTKKQWDVYPESLSPLVLSRIPVREDWDDRYFPNDPYQALPADGYTRWFEEALDHPNIVVKTGVDYFDLVADPPSWFKGKGRKDAFEKTFFTGQIDQFFRNLRGSTLKPLQYRSINFETIVKRDQPDVTQPAFVVNYPQFRDGKFTRVAEYKHMYHQAGNGNTILVREYSTDIKPGQEPYYPYPTKENQAHFEKYKELAKKEERENNVHFVGRLANYKYFNMDDAIENTLELYNRIEFGSRNKLAEALREGRARRGKNGALSVHVVLSFAEGGAGELQHRNLIRGASDVSAKAPWLGSLCAKLAEMGARQTYFAFGISNVEDLRQALMKTSGCKSVASALREGRDLFVRPTNRLNAEAHWFEHLSAASFSFGDANLFLPVASVDGKSIVQQVKTAVTAQKEELFMQGLMQATNTATVKKNVRVHPGFLGKSKKVTMKDIISLKDENAVAVLPLSPEGLQPVPKSSVCPVRFRESMFVATDTAIRRMLSVHRTNLFDNWLPKLRKDNSSTERLQDELYCMFFENLH